MGKTNKKRGKKSLLGTLGTVVILILYLIFEFMDNGQAASGQRHQVELVRVVDGDTIIVDFQDQYERTLAYVWMNADGTEAGEDMLNGIIVKNGYADARSYEPNVKYQDALEALEQAR